ncbi:MAG TPA: plastocyanin/azurin family copper-binding protein [Chloroflexota bacterium]
MNARGFLGTNASLLSDLSLVIGLLVALTLTVGVAMAVLKKYHLHRWIQSTAVGLNVLQVALIMVGSFFKSAAPGIPSKLGESYFAFAVGHGLLGSLTLLLGVFIAVRANELLPSFLHFLRFHNYKLFMRTAYVLYMSTTALGVAVYLNWYTGQPAESAAPEPAVAERANGRVVVPMKGFAFTPDQIVVPVGSTVVWINQDGAPHTATADDGQTFQSDLLSNGQSFSFTASAPGEFPYYCEFHGSAGGVGMSGSIKVVAAGEAPLIVAAPPITLTPEPTSVVDAQRLPDGTFAGIHSLLVEGRGLPIKQGYAVGLKNETAEMQHHVKLLVQSEAVGDLPGIRRHAEHVFNLVVGALDPDFGDLDGDGRAQNAGDGFGLLVNGEQPGYIKATLDAAVDAGAAPDATQQIKVHAGHVKTSTENMHGWALEARGIALELTQVRELAAVDARASRLLALAKSLAVGNDANADGEISPIAGEGGARVAYEHAQFMAITR